METEMERGGKREDDSGEFEMEAESQEERRKDYTGAFA